MIHQHAQSLLSNLALERKSEEVSGHPIIFVVHSLGGILLKRALELSYDLTSKNADDNRSIYVSTYGVIFLGTPHNGADAAKWGLILQGMVNALVPKKIMETEAQMIKTLQTNNETLQNINLHFLDIYQRFKICMVHEQEKTDLKGTKTLIVLVFPKNGTDWMLTFYQRSRFCWSCATRRGVLRHRGNALKHVQIRKQKLARLPERLHHHQNLGPRVSSDNSSEMGHGAEDKKADQRGTSR